MTPKTMLTIIGIFLFVITLNSISAVSITDVSSFPEEAIPGQIIDVSIEIENIFSEDIENLIVKLNLSGENIPFAPYQSSSEKFLDELDSGDEEIFKFRLITLPEAQSGIYKIPVTISYENKEKNVSIKDEISLISLIINSQPELKVSLDDSSVLIKGKENSFSIKIINSGLADVKFVYLSVSDVNGIKFLSEKEQYVGDIDSDDFDRIEYNVYVNADASKTINLPVILKFKDATNKEFIESKSIILRTYSLKEAQKLGFTKKPNYSLYIIISILVTGFIFYRILRKRKLKNRR